MRPVRTSPDLPPHCPNLECAHYEGPKTSRWYQKAGTYRTRAFGVVPRFFCKSCRKYFSSQTFSIDYYAKCVVPYLHIYNHINAGGGIRSIARDLEIRDSTVTNRIHRLSRNALILNQVIAGDLPLREDLVVDGLQNFCVSQYFPDNTTIMVGADSQFAYDCDYATLRRCGRMTGEQRRRRGELEKQYRADPGAVQTSFLRLLRGIEGKLKDRQFPLILYTDAKQD